MRILRGMHASTVASFFILAVATSSIFIVLTPRTTHAEGPLVGTVRCVLKTVLLQKCQPVAPTGAGASKPSASTKPSGAADEGSASGSGEELSTLSSGASAEQPKTSSSTAVSSPAAIPLPKETAPMAPIEQAAPLQAAMTQAEQLAFFNTYSPYARTAQLQRASVTPLEISREGWKLMGLAWYWWAMMGLLGVVIFTSIKRLNLREASGLSDKGESAKVEKNT